MKLSKRSTKLIEEFAMAAKIHGWQEDQGTGQKVINAENAFNLTKKKLERHILRLEKRKETNLSKNS